MRRSGEDTGVTVEFGTVLSYTKVVKKARTVQKVDGGSKIQALSIGKGSGNDARIVVNDKDVLEKSSRGFNVVVLAGQNHEVISQSNYDTSRDSKASQKMIEDYNAVPVGSVYVAAVMDDAAGALSNNAKEIFRSMGGTEINKLAAAEGFLFIGIKGSRSHLEKRGAQVSAGLILGYSRVTRREKQTKTITQTKSYQRTIRRVYKKTIVEKVGGRTVRRTITRVQRRVVTCHRSRTTTRSSTRTSVN